MSKVIADSLWESMGHHPILFESRADNLFAKSYFPQKGFRQNIIRQKLVSPKRVFAKNICQRAFAKRPLEHFSPNSQFATGPWPSDMCLKSFET